MMKGLWSVLHPSFDALSAFADESDVDGARTRVGRHVRDCAACRAVVVEIRELGASARASAVEHEGEGAPGALWTRIERAAREWTEAAPSTAVSPKIPSAFHEAPRVALAIAAAAAVVAVLAWPSDHSLQASGTSRLTFSPSRPVPGGVMSVRYRPIAALKGASHLILIGSWTDRSGVLSYGATRVADSIAVLLPTGDGSYEARVQLPSDFRTVQMAVTDSAAAEVDTDGYMLWSAIGGTRDGKASLPSLLATASWYPFVNELDASTTPRQSMSPADSLKRYFPDHPAGWAYSRRMPRSGSPVERLIAFFQSSERKYLVFHERLWPQQHVDAERLHDMYVFASTISEPGEANKWARRLALEHPEDPRAFVDLLDALHQVELTEPPHLADSIRPWFPVLDRVYQAASLTPDDAYKAQTLVSRYADSATKQNWVWRIESSEAAARRRFPYWNDAASASPKQLAAAEAYYKEVLAEPCVRPPGKYPMVRPFGDWLGHCRRERAFAFNLLARARFLAGDAAAARSYADSAIATPAFGGCGGFQAPYYLGAKASLSLGDTTTAIRDLVIGASRGGRADSVAKWLGRRYDAVPFKAATDSARKVLLACVETQRAKKKARDARRVGDNR